MNDEKIKEMINGYFDDELNKEEEILLFSVLSENEEGREYFKSLAALNEAVSKTHEEFPQRLDERILASLPQSETGAGKGRAFVSPPALFAYAVSVILLVVLLMFKSELNQYKDELQTQASVINRQNKMIELLYNSLPTATVQAERKAPIIVTPEVL